MWFLAGAVGTAGNGGLPSRGPISWEEMGERTPEGRGSSLWTPFSGGCVGGGCTSYEIPGLRPSQQKARNGPPTSWAGWGRGWVPFGKRREKTISFFVSVFFETQPFNFLLSPTVNESLLPPARAGGRAMRRWSLRPQARYADPRTTLLLQQSREKGRGGKKLFPPRGSRGQSPLVFFPLFLQRNRAPAGKPRFPPVPTAWGKPPAASPEKPKTIPAERPHRPPQGWFPRKNKGDQYPRSSPTRHTRVSPTPPRGRHSTDSPLQMRSGLRQS